MSDFGDALAIFCGFYVHDGKSSGRSRYFGGGPFGTGMEFVCVGSWRLNAKAAASRRVRLKSR